MKTALKMGPLPTTDEKDFIAEAGQRIVGFWGAQTKEAITQIGMLVADEACIEEFGVDKEIADNVDDTNTDFSIEDDDGAESKTVSFRSKTSEETNKDDSDEIILIVVIVIVAVIVLALLVILITHFVTKKRGENNKAQV